MQTATCVQASFASAVRTVHLLVKGRANRLLLHVTRQAQAPGALTTVNNTNRHERACCDMMRISHGFAHMAKVPK